MAEEIKAHIHQRKAGEFPAVNDQFKAKAGDKRVILLYSKEAELKHGSQTATIKNTAGHDTVVIFTAALPRDKAADYPYADAEFAGKTTREIAEGAAIHKEGPETTKPRTTKAFTVKGMGN